MFGDKICLQNRSDRIKRRLFCNVSFTTPIRLRLNHTTYPRDNPRISGMILLQEKGKIHSLEDNSLMAVDPLHLKLEHFV